MEIKIQIENPTYRVIKKIVALEESTIQMWLEQAIFNRLEADLDAELRDLVDYELSAKRAPLEFVG